MRTTPLVCRVLIPALLLAQLAAQPASDARHEQKIRSRVAYALDHHRVVALETADHRRFAGMVSEAEQDRFVLAIQGRTTMLTYAEVDHVTWEHPVPRPVVAVLVAGAVAVALYVVLDRLLAKNG